MNPAIWLMRTATADPDAPALLRGTTLVATYRDFARSSLAIGGWLRDTHGIRPGDRVALWMTNSPAYLDLLYGAWAAGAVVVPINAKLHARESAWIMEHAEASVAFVSATLAGDLAAVAPGGLQEIIAPESPVLAVARAHDRLSAPVPRGAQDTVWLFYTSGTTGRPKGVMLSSANLQAMTYCYLVDVDPVHRGDAALYAAPMSHGAGLYNFMHVLRGARHVVPDSSGFDPAEILALAPQLGDVSMFAAPTMVKRLVDHAKSRGLTGEGIRTLVYGGGPMYVADIIEAVDVMGPRFVQIYGQGESPMTITALSRALVADRTHPRWRARLASVGTAQSAVSVRIADGHGQSLPPGEVGEILVSGLAVMSGYWRDPDATAKTIRDGWLWTGDMGFMDEEGFVTLQDRSKDVIISGGTNIYPREIEEVLLTHAAVQEVAVIGRPDPDWGEAVVAFVVAAPGASPDSQALDRHCLDHIARFKRPRTYRWVTALPKNNYGKVLKTALRDQLAKEPPPT